MSYRYKEIDLDGNIWLHEAHADLFNAVDYLKFNAEWYRYDNTKGFYKADNGPSHMPENLDLVETLGSEWTAIAHRHYEELVNAS